MSFNFILITFRAFYSGQNFIGLHKILSIVALMGIFRIHCTQWLLILAVVFSSTILDSLETLRG